jgi:hypothetical protein
MYNGLGLFYAPQVTVLMVGIHARVPDPPHLQEEKTVLIFISSTSSFQFLFRRISPRSSSRHTAWNQRSPSPLLSYRVNLRHVAFPHFTIYGIAIEQYYGIEK